MADQTTSEDSFWKQSTSRCSKIGSWTSRRHWVAFVAAGCPRPVYLHTLQMHAQQPCNLHNIAARRLWKSETSNISVAATIEWVACSHPDRGAKIFSARKLINTTPHSRQAQQSAKTRRDAKRIRELEFVCDAMLAASFSSQPDIFREQDLAHHRVAFRIERLGSVRRY
jgi:hypothetical protein